MEEAPQYLTQTKTFINSLTSDCDPPRNDASLLASRQPEMAIELSSWVQGAAHPGYQPHVARNNIHDCRDRSPLRAYQMPLTRAVLSRGQETHTYTPFALQDVAMLKQSLPPLDKGGSLWINEFLKLNAGADLAIGDWRRVFSACTNVSALTALENEVGSVDLPDREPLSRIINTLWPKLREAYPLRLNTSDLYSIPLKAGERGTAYLQRTREHWENYIGEDPMTAEASLTMLYRGAVESSMPTPIKESLKRVVGLSAMEFSMWAMYITHHIDLEEDRSAQAVKNLAELHGQLINIQLQQAKDVANQTQVEKQLTVTANRDFMAGSPKKGYKERYKSNRNTNFSRKKNPNTLCFQCGQHGHWRGQCPQNPARRHGFRRPPPPFRCPSYYDG